MKLDAAQAHALEHLYRTTDLTLTEVGRIFGISKNSVWNIVVGEHPANSERRQSIHRAREKRAMQKRISRGMSPLARKVIRNDYQRLVVNRPIKQSKPRSERTA